jgi:molybdopterin synthase catalytic subunit
MIHLTDTPIDVAAVLEEVRSPAAGAVVLFLGTVRESTGQRQVRFLRYESYAAMAERTLLDLQGEAQGRWPLTGCAIVHRLGEMAVGETSVAIATSAAHREPAFEAGKWLIDRIKETVPIWKQEHWADGTSQWVHPQQDAETAPDAEKVPGTVFGRGPSPAESLSPKTVPGTFSGGKVTK